jgi:hypothetical protein
LLLRHQRTRVGYGCELRALEHTESISHGVDVAAQLGRRRTITRGQTDAQTGSGYHTQNKIGLFHLCLLNDYELNDLVSNRFIFSPQEPNTVAKLTDFHFGRFK